MANAEKEVDVANWVDEKIKTEIARLKEHDYKCIPIKVKNISLFSQNRAITNEEGTFINRVECDTAFDFDKVETILISPPEVCPMKQNYSYVNVILFCKKVPLILPYLYDSTYSEKGHTLKEWIFINNQLRMSRQQIDSFEDCYCVFFQTGHKCNSIKSAFAFGSRL